MEVFVYVDYRQDKDTGEEQFETLEGNLVREWPSVKAVEEETGWNRGFIANCCRGLDHYNTGHGFIWRYAE